MTQPINPLTTLTTSLQVDKLEQTKNMADMIEQGIVGQEQKSKNAKKEQRVNKNEELDRGKLGKEKDDNEGGYNSEKKEDEEDRPAYAKKGDVFDVKI